MKSKESYLNDVCYCPNCNGTNINTRIPPRRADVTTIHHTVQCMDCAVEWVDVFTLNDVLGFPDE